MQIMVADWLLDVDVAQTMSISDVQAADHCTCGYCRNFYTATDASLPTFRPFLQQFGVDMEGPDEFSPFEPTIYEATYLVQGEILKKGHQNLRIDGIPLKILTQTEVDFPTSHPAPYFALRIGLFELPWVIDEPMDEVVSPANTEECLNRMEQKLLSYSLENDILA